MSCSDRIGDWVGEGREGGGGLGHGPRGPSWPLKNSPSGVLRGKHWPRTGQPNSPCTLLRCTPWQAHRPQQQSRPRPLAPGDPNIRLWVSYGVVGQPSNTAPPRHATARNAGAGFRSAQCSKKQHTKLTAVRLPVAKYKRAATWAEMNYGRGGLSRESESDRVGKSDAASMESE